MKAKIKSITLIPILAAAAAITATSCADLRPSKPAENYGQQGNEANRHSTDPTKHHHTGNASSGVKDPKAKPGSGQWDIKKQ
jgi:hypothetical protein